MMENNLAKKVKKNQRKFFFKNPQFWSIVIIFVLITLHHYDNFTSFRVLAGPDLPLGITRHTIDRILYLIPVFLSSVAFGPKEGNLTLVLALVAMLPRAIFISPTPLNALWETLVITLIGSLAPIGADYYFRQEEQLEETEKRYKQLFESAHDAIWVQDLDYKVTAANQAAANLFGCNLSDLVGSDIRRFFSSDRRKGPRIRKEDILKNKLNVEPYVNIIKKMDGTEAYVMLAANIIYSGNMPDGIQFIGRDITKEIKMQEDLNYYFRKITNAHEEERQRISRDLHDSTIQNLVVILRRLEKFCEENDGLSKEKLEFLLKLHEQIKGLIIELRQLSRDLRPSILDDLGLVPAVEWLAQQLESQNNIGVKLTVLGDQKRFTSEIEVTLFRIIQEALRNVVKHSEATHTTINIAFKDSETWVTITDDGKGFELPSRISELSRQGKLGIDGMQTRARLAGGTFEIQSSPGDGTAVFVKIPS